MKFGKKYIISGFAAVFLLLSSIFYYQSELKNDKIHRGIKIDAIDVSRLSKEEAKDLILQAEYDKYQGMVQKFVADDKEITVPLSDIGHRMNIDAAIDKAYEYGRDGNNASKFFKIVSAAIYNRNIKLERDFQISKLNHSVRKLADEVYKSPQDAYLFEKANGDVDIISEKTGRYLDLNETKELIKENVPSDEPLKLPIYKTDAKLSKEYFVGIDKLLSEFTTDYSSSEKNRKSNIALGASFFNNMLIKPGEEVSFNDTVGKIDSNHGFKNAGVIINGELDRGVGGGICQVSTTLYNSLIKADLEIVERSNHSRPIHYVPLGMDAAVMAGYKDLKFKNDTNHPIFIESKTDGEHITFKIFGNSKDRDYEVKIIPKFLGTISPRTIKRYSSSMYEDETSVEKSGSKGYSYETYKEIIKGDKKSVEKISSSYYVPQDRIILIGSKERSSNSDDSDSDD